MKTTKNARTLSTWVLAGCLTASVLPSQALASYEQAQGDYRQKTDSTHSKNMRMSDKAQKHEAAVNESIGIGSGFMVGALLGGPIGAFLGTGAGHLFADHVNDHQKAQHQLAKLAETEKAYAKLLLENEMMRIAMRESVSEPAKTVKVNQVVPVESQIQFLTASDKVQAHYYASLDTLAEAVKATPNIQVQLFGYADRRGDEEYNQALSEKRVASVKRYLLAKGVAPAQIDATSYGEAQPVLATQHWEHDFFDRRVVIRIQPVNPVMTAANP